MIVSSKRFINDAKASLRERMIADDTSTALVEVSRPSLAMDLPYQSYSITRANGDPVERVDKHAFCGSRHYDRSEIDQDVWFFRHTVSVDGVRVHPKSAFSSLAFSVALPSSLEAIFSHAHLRA